MAHDLRGPLSALNLLSARFSSPVERTLFAKSAQRIQEIADDLLVRSRKAKEVAVFDVGELLREIVMEVSAGFNGSEVVLNLPENRALEISGHRTDISRAIANLLRNAVESGGDLG